MPVFKPELTLAIGVADFKRAADWYTSVLGLQQLYVVEDIGWGEFATPLAGANIGIQQAPAGEPAGGNGGACITFSVEDIDAVRAELEGKGVVFDGPTSEIPGMVRLAGFRDPDGNALMLAQTLQMG